MPGFSITDFGGQSSAVSPKLLKANVATEAINCQVGNGQLKPLRGTTYHAALPGINSPESIHLYEGGQFFAWATDVDVAPVPNAFDDTNKFVFTGDTYPRIANNTITGSGSQNIAGSYRLGLPVPTVAPSATVSGTPNENVLEETRYYVFTWVDAWGEESAPSPASGAVTYKDGQTTAVSLPALPPTGNYNWGTGSLKRIYRTNTGSSATDFQYVGEILISATSFTDTTEHAALGEVIPTVDWVRPPDDDTTDFPTGQMMGATTLPSGAIVGFSGHTLVYSMPYIPYAFPLSYRYHVKDEIVGVAANTQGLVVLTKGKPHLAIGHDPASVSIMELDEYQACVSKRSIVDMGESVIYASPDGLVRVAGQDVSIITEGVFNRDQWNSLAIESIHAYRHDGKYIAFFGAESGGFMFDPNSAEQAYVSHNIDATAGHYDPLEDVLYLAGTSDLYTWAQGDSREYTWRSKVFAAPRPMSLAAMKVEATSSNEPLTITIAVDGAAPAYQVDVTAAGVYRLPLMPLSTQFQITLSGTMVIDRITFATSMQELNSVE